MNATGLKSVLLAAAIGAGIQGNTQAAVVSSRLLDAIAHIESGKKNGIKVKDTNGLFSYGMYQIQEPYLKDANEYMRTNYTLDDVRYKPEIARKVVNGYLSRYGKAFAKKHGRAPTARELAAMHNGGPSGYKKENAKKYASKVLSVVSESAELS